MFYVNSSRPPTERELNTIAVEQADIMLDHVERCSVDQAKCSMCRRFLAIRSTLLEPFQEKSRSRKRRMAQCK
ncbi:MAG: hypothetical protein RIR25_616 [Verrucomicrobiota bacterium]